MQLNILSAGAAQGVVMALAAQLKAETGTELKAGFGAVGTIYDRLMAGEPCDLIILTQALIAELAVHGRVLSGTAADLGTVRTGIAVRTGDPLPDVSTAAGLRAALIGSDGIYFPDATKSTAGIHFAKVIDSLGIRHAVATRLRTFPNGATAMRAMVNENAFDLDSHLIGCTQVTEINNTPGAVLAGVLPQEFELATVYSVGVCADAASMAVARRFADMLTNEASIVLRTKHGYEFSVL
ncbi:MAG TPA: substrate-binding domain-containing protein [Usitatibacteraceae bacterium]